MHPKEKNHIKTMKNGPDISIYKFIDEEKLGKDNFCMAYWEAIKRLTETPFETYTLKSFMICPTSWLESMCVGEGVMYDQSSYKDTSF